MASKFLEGEKYRGLCRQISVGGGEFIEAGRDFKEDWNYAEMLRKEIENYLAEQLRSYRELGGRPLTSSTRWIGDNFYIYMFGKSSSSGEKVEFHVSNLCVGKCSAAILKKLIEELEELDAYRLNKALASMI